MMSSNRQPYERRSIIRMNVNLNATYGNAIKSDQVIIKNLTEAGALITRPRKWKGDINKEQMLFFNLTDPKMEFRLNTKIKHLSERVIGIEFFDNPKYMIEQLIAFLSLDQSNVKQ